MSDMISPSELASKWRRSRQWVYERVKDGTIPSKRLGDGSRDAILIPMSFVLAVDAEAKREWLDRHEGTGSSTASTSYAGHRMVANTAEQLARARKRELRSSSSGS